MERHVTTTSRAVDPFLSLDEAAGTLGVSKMTVRRIVGRDELRLTRVTPRRVAIRKSELERYIAEREAVA